MALIHDAYLFNPEDFANSIVKYVEWISSKDGYTLLRIDALEMFRTNSQTRLLADRYGGWDEKGITTQVPVDEPQGLDDVAFWLILLLYGHLKVGRNHLGLGGDWQEFSDMLVTHGWNEHDCSLLVEGFDFEHLAAQFIYKDTSPSTLSGVGTSYWHYFHPFSTGGRAGWLGLNDILRLRQHLVANDSLYSTLHDEDPKTEAIAKAYSSATDMLNAAIEANCGLCLIISG